MSSGNETLLDDEDSLEDAIRKARKEFPRLCEGAWTVGRTAARALDTAIEGPSPQHHGEVQRRYRRVASAKKTPTVGVP